MSAAGSECIMISPLVLVRIVSVHEERKEKARPGAGCQVPAPVLSPVLTWPGMYSSFVEVPFGSLFRKGLGTPAAEAKVSDSLELWHL